MLVSTSFNPENAKIGKFSGKHAFGQVWKISSCSDVYTGIPRDSELIFEIDSKEYLVKTDSTQKNYYVNAKFNNYGSAPCVKYECGNPDSSYSVTTNFGYEK